MSKDNNLFIENCLIIINEDGTVTKVPRILQERNHRNAFFRLNKENPSALTYFPWEELYHCDGYEFANYVAAIGKVIFWPTSIDSPEYMMVTLPEIPTNKQEQSIYHIFPLLKKSVVDSYVTHFDSPYTLDFIVKELSSSGNYEDALRGIVNYVKEAALKHKNKVLVKSNFS